MHFTPEEIVETLTMITRHHLDVRTITLGLSLAGCADSDIDLMARRVYERITFAAAELMPLAQQLEREYGIPIINKRIAVTPVAQLAAATQATDLMPLAQALDRAAAAVGIDFIGGFSALVHKGICDADARLIASIPRALAATERVCASVNVATTRAGINMDAVLAMAQTVLDTAQATADRDSVGCAELVVFANMVEDNPFMAGAVHGSGEPDVVVNVGISGPGVVRAVVESLPQEADLTIVAEAINAAAAVAKHVLQKTELGLLIDRSPLPSLLGHPNVYGLHGNERSSASTDCAGARTQNSPTTSPPARVVSAS